MISSRPFVSLLGVLVFVSVVGAEQIKRIQQPCISPDGKTIVFSWQGDLWSVGRDGGQAVRLTVHPAMETRPHWFPDGSKIVFSSNRFGAFNLFTISPDGSHLKRLNYESAPAFPTAVSADGQYVYGYTSYWSRSDLFRIRATGGPLVRLTSHPFESAYLPVLSLDGKTVYYNRGSYGPNSWQKPGIRSSALPDIWAADNTVPLSNHRRITNNETTDLSPQVGADGTLTYISNADGWPNVWRMNPDGSNAHQLTHHVDGTSRNPSISKDGRYVAYEFESELYLLDVETGADKLVSVEVPDDARTNPVQPISLDSGVTDYAVSPDAKRMAIVVRGELFLVPEKGGTTRKLADHVGLDYQPVWLDAKTILYVATGEHSKRELRTVTVDGSVKTFESDPTLDCMHPSVSPDGKQVAFQRGGTEIDLVPAIGGVPKTLIKANLQDALDGDGSVLSWSPDSKWVAMAIGVERREDITLIQAETGKTVVIAKLALRPDQGGSSTPKFLPNGKGVYFLSAQYGKPDLFLVDLIPQEPTFTEDDLDKIDAPKPEKPDNHVEVYEPGIDERLRRLTKSGASDAQASADGKSIWTNIDGQLSTVNLKTGAITPVATVTGAASDLALGPGGAKLYYIQKDKLFAIGLKEPGIVPIPFQTDYIVNSRDEEKALFEDIWWAMDRLYYNEKMNGKDWNAIRTKYAKIVPYTYDRADFYALMGEMMEELDSSHLGSIPPPSEIAAVTPEPTGLVGVEFDARALDARDVYRVSRIVPNSPADNPASMLKVGDQILTIDGEEPSYEHPVAELLNRKTGKHVVIKVDRDGVNKTIDIRPAALGSLTELEYQAWVRHERALVDQISGGKIGYLHIRAMDQPSLEEFLRESRIQGEGKQGLIVDCRYNGGGSTAVDVLGVLIKTPWLMRTTRGELGIHMSEDLLRSDAVEMPTALMVNSGSFSNAEIMAEGFRALKRGPIIGERTPGYVIGTGVHALWDGGRVRMPAIGAYAVNGENLENNGRRPDINVWFDPNAWDQGRDPQIEKAVQALLK
jgi:tricorn protease